MNEKEYTSTLHLPKTDFQMKANLPNKNQSISQNGLRKKFMKKA